MRRSHPTLQVSSNLVMIAIYGTLSGVLWLFLRPGFRATLAAAALCIGCLGGGLQALSLRARREALLTAESMIDIRRIMTSTPSGRAYICIFWSYNLTALVYYVVLAPKSPVLPLFLYSAFGFARDLVTLPLVFKMRAAAGDGTVESQD